MSKRIRRIHSPAVKVKVALAAMKNDKTIAEIAQQFERFTRRRSASGVGNSWTRLRRVRRERSARCGTDREHEVALRQDRTAGVGD